MLNSIPNPLRRYLTSAKMEQLQLLREYVLNKTHKCFQSCTASNNIIYYTYTFIEGEPVVTVVVQCPVCNQLTYLLYTSNSYNTPIYRESFLSVPFIRTFLKNYSPYPLSETSLLYQYLTITLNNYYLYLQVKKNKRAYYEEVSDIFNYCCSNTMLLQPLLLLKHFLISSDTWKNKLTILTMLSLNKKQIHEIFSLSKKQVHEVDKITKEKQLTYYVH